MSQPNQSLKSNLDDRLADFTDEALAGRMQQSASRADGRLLPLEETVLRLKNAHPPAALDEARVKQMLVRLKSRIRRETQETERPFWKDWLTRPQARMAAAVLSVLLLLALAFPFLTTSGSSTTATALTPAQGMYAAAGLAVVIVVILWIKRRK